MKIQKASHKKAIILSVIGALLIVAAATAYYLKIQSDNAIEKSHEKANSSDSQNPQSKSNLPSTDSTNVDPSKSTDEVPVKQDASLIITKLEQSGGSVSYAATFDGIDGNGTCSAQFTASGAKPVTSTTKASGQECSASISEVNFNLIGTWTLTLRYYTANTQVTATKAINVQ
jgi:hypothetical protein